MPKPSANVALSLYSIIDRPRLEAVVKKLILIRYLAIDTGK